MPLAVPTCEPASFVAGDTVAWTKTLADFQPADGWSLKYRLVGAVSEIAADRIDAEDNGVGGWDVTIASGDSILAAGTYRLIGWVEKTSPAERHTIFDDIVAVGANVAIGSPQTLQTQNARVLAAIEARLEGRVTADQESVTIDGTQLTRIPIEQLAMLRGVYAARVWREQHQDRSYPQHAVRFGHAD